MRLGFVGTGVMGCSMAGHLLAAGHEVRVSNRTAEKARDLLDRGATWARTPGEAAVDRDAVFTMVGYPADVEQVYLGPGNILDSAAPGALLVDMTTSRPDLAARIAVEADRRGLSAIDAPVSGGDIGAREARLSIMVGGEPAAFERALPLLRLMGTNIVLQGPAGSGQYTKMCNQIVIASSMVGLCEALAYARAAGLDPSGVLRSIEKGAAGSWSLSNLAPRIIAGDFAPGFYVKHFIKDLAIAVDSARALGLRSPGLELAARLYGELAAAGGSEEGTQALYRLYAPG